MSCLGPGWERSIRDTFRGCLSVGFIGIWTIRKTYQVSPVRGVDLDHGGVDTCRSVGFMRFVQLINAMGGSQGRRRRGKSDDEGVGDVGGKHLGVGYPSLIVLAGFC